MTQTHIIAFTLNDSILKRVKKYSQPNAASLNIFDQAYDLINFLPHDFTISTNTGSYKFNVDMLKDTSSVIFNVLLDDPRCNQYHIDINDEKNVMDKINLLYQGKSVSFDDGEILFVRKISEILNLKCLPEFMQPYKTNHSNLFMHFAKCNNYEIQISQLSLISFLKNAFGTYTISIKGKDYECNIYGVRASRKINDLIQSDPQFQLYKYDIDDEFNDFQLICDVFNFEAIQITNNNMMSLKQFAEDLQIDSILGKINVFIDRYEGTGKIIDEKEVIINRIDQIFDLLYNRSHLSVKDCTLMITKEKWAKSEDTVRELGACFLNVMLTDFSTHNFLNDLLFSLNKESENYPNLKFLIPCISKRLMDHFGSSKLNCALIYRFYKNGYIPLNDIQYRIAQSYMNVEKKMNAPDSKSTSKTLSPTSNALIWFLPEAVELFKLGNESIDFAISKFNKTYSNFIKFYYPDKMDEYTKMRDSNEPDDAITKAILHDDPDSLQSIFASMNDFENLPNKKIPFNIFDSFITNDDISYINYAAACGSARCFNYLYLNQLKIEKQTFKYAVFGENTEIIRKVDQSLNDNQITINYDLSDVNDNNNNNNNRFNLNRLRGNRTPNKDIEINPIFAAIQKHQNDLFDWILQEKYINDGKTGSNLEYFIIYSAKYGDAHSFIQCIDNGLDINLIPSQKLTKILTVLSSKGYYKFLQLFLSLVNNKSFIVQQDLQPSIASGNLEIFKMILSFCRRIDLFDEQLFSAIRIRYQSIIKYIVEVIFKDEIKLSKKGLIDCLCLSFTISPKSFNYLFENLGFDRMMEKYNLTGYDFIKILCNSIPKINNKENYLNIEFVTTLILDKFKDTFFTEPFILATKTRMFDICHFFIDKKVPINLYTLSKRSPELRNIDEQIFHLLIKDANDELKQIIFSNFLYPTIEAKNVKIVEFLLKQGIPYDNALFKAVECHDIETVKVVLNNDSKPSFINQISEEGTALNYAVSNGNKDIVKLLLEIPGIDPNLYQQNNYTPLITAITKLDIEMINILLDYFGDNIQAQMWQLNEALKKLLEKLSSKDGDEKQVGAMPPNNINQNRLAANRAGVAARQAANANQLAPIAANRAGVAVRQPPNANQNAPAPANQNINHSIVLPVIKRLMEIKNLDLNCHAHDYTLLIYACEVNDQELVKMLIESNNVNVNSYAPSNGYTPLMIAISKKNEEVAQILIECPQTNINIRNYKKETALTIAVIQNLPNIVSILLSCPKFDRNESRLDYAFFISSGKISKLLYSIDGLDINYKTVKQSETMGKIKFYVTETSLINAVKKKSLDKIRMIVNHKTFNHDKSLVTAACFEAAKTNDVAVFREVLPLVNNDVNIMLEENESLLIYSVKNRCNNIIAEILNQDNFDSRKSDILTAFTYIFNPKFVFNIGNIGGRIIADINSLTLIYDYDQHHDRLIDFSSLLPNGSSFFTLIQYDFTNVDSIVQFFLQNGADPDKPDQNGVYPLQHAIMHSYVIFRLLLDTNKIDLDRKLTIVEKINKGSYTTKAKKNPFGSFFSANKAGNHGFLNNADEIETITKYGVTYLHLAAQMADYKFFNDLMQFHIIDLNSVDSFGESPLFYAVRKGNIVLINNLFMLDDLDYKLKNKSGHDALAVASSIANIWKENESIETKGDYLAALISIVESKNFREKAALKQ